MNESEKKLFKKVLLPIFGLPQKKKNTIYIYIYIYKIKLILNIELKKQNQNWLRK
jgi:hypothetical protein